MCYALANEGASTVVLDRNAEGADAVASKIKRGGGKAISVNADVQSIEHLRAMADEVMSTFGQLNILVNNAEARMIK